VIPNIRQVASQCRGANYFGATLQRSKNDAAHSLPVAQIYIGLAEKDRAFEWLEKAVDQHQIGLGLKSEAMFDPLRSDPRFRALLRQMKLSQ